MDGASVDLGGAVGGCGKDERRDSAHERAQDPGATNGVVLLKNIHGAVCVPALAETTSVLYPGPETDALAHVPRAQIRDRWIVL